MSETEWQSAHNAQFVLLAGSDAHLDVENPGEPLPIQLVHLDETISQSDLTANETKRFARNPLSILVVEDDPLIGMLLAEMLEEMGFDVCSIETGEAEAVSAAIRYLPDLMIVDAQLGAGSGIAAVTQILSTVYIPHVFVSAEISRIKAHQPGAVMIQKPYREVDLAQAIERALSVASGPRNLS